MQNKWHTMSHEELESELKTDISGGLTMMRARERLVQETKEQSGQRKYLFAKTKPSVFKCIMSVVGDPMMILLLSVSLLSWLFGASAQGFLTFCVSVICGAVCAVMSYISEKRLSSASDNSSPVVRVVRGKDKYYTDGRNVVKGDILELESGDLLPCDARIISSRELLVKEIISTSSGIKNRTVEKSADREYTEGDGVFAPHAENILYAGSAVLTGSARAVAIATGNEVYLAKYIQDGELSGFSAQMSFERELKPIIQRIRAISVLATVLLTLLSLVTARNGAVIDSFLLILSSVVLISCELLTVVCRYISSAYIHKLSIEKKKASKRQGDLSSSVKSPMMLDKLGELTSLVIMGRAGLTEGAFKVRKTYTADSVLDTLTADKTTGNRLLTYIYTYIKTLESNRDETNAVSGDIATALMTHVKNSGFDYGAADIYLRELYYVHDGKRGYACAETSDMQFRTALTFDDDILDYCELVRHTDEQIALTEDDKKRAKGFCERSKTEGAQCLYIVSEYQGVATLEGVIALEQTAIKGFEWTVSELLVMGLKTIMFFDNESDITLLSALEAEQCYDGRIAKASSFEGGEITARYKDFDVFAGFSKEQYAEIVDKMRADGERIAIFSVDNENNSVTARADVAVSCDMIRYSSDKYKESVFEKLPLSGRDTSTRCSSQTRLFSGVIVKRAHSDGGGVTAFLNAVKTARMTDLALCSAVELFVLLLSAMLPFCVLSTVLGTQLLGAFQALSFAASAMLLPTLMLNESDFKAGLILPSASERRHPIKAIAKRLPSIIARGAVSAFAAIAVCVMDVLGVFGESPTYSLAIYMALMLALFVETAVFHGDRTQRGEGRNRRWIKVIMAYFALLLLCGVSTQGLFFDSLYRGGMGTLEFIIVPAYLVLYVIAVMATRAAENKRNLKR